MREGIWGILTVAATIIVSLISGFVAWQLIAPDSFWSVLIFLFVWFVFARLGRYLAVGAVLLALKLVEVITES